jgi:hypothetical protein
MWSREGLSVVDGVAVGSAERAALASATPFRSSQLTNCSCAQVVGSVGFATRFTGDFGKKWRYTYCRHDLVLSLEFALVKPLLSVERGRETLDDDIPVERTLFQGRTNRSSTSSSRASIPSSSVTIP